MKRLQKKLHSQRGASLLLALLMFLICMMVSASVLAAASSNVGKTRSNQVEQQKYLTLSSAIRLVADEIQKAAYTGKYTVYELTIPEQVDSTTGEVTVPRQDYFFCVQTVGDYSGGDLTELIPLGDWLDEIFSEQFDESKGYRPLDLSAEAALAKCTLTVELPTTLPNGYPEIGTGAYQIPEVVTVNVKLNRATHHIMLEASLGSDTMIAELVVQADTTMAINYNPAGRIADSTIIGNAGSVIKDVKLPTMKWTLHWIKKGAA